MTQEGTYRPRVADHRAVTVDDLIEAITRKLSVNRPVLERSLQFGRLSWRLQKNGELEVDLEPKL
ncbi:MAG: hypothetical protein HY664_06745 [Chloroflexi bacterium]|nr:hypothetical protein [Chloroflexota bacterium]